MIIQFYYYLNTEVRTDGNEVTMGAETSEAHGSVTTYAMYALL